MRTIQHKRFSDDTKQTLGIWSFVKNDGQLFVCKTLELPWKNNLHDVSCIPAGGYICKYTKSPKMSAEKLIDFYTYEIMNVTNRSGIRIHSANYFSQLLGCIALGDAHKDINADGEPDTIHSGKTIEAFEKEMNKQDFYLTISYQ